MLESSVIDLFLKDMDSSLAVIAALFLFSLPLGYGQHQLVVNIYRSHEKKRAVFEALEDMVEEAEQSVGKKAEIRQASLVQRLNQDARRKNSFLTALLDICFYVDKPLVDPGVHERISNRWSFFYARRAVGRYAPIFSTGLWVILLIIGYFASWPLIYQLPNFAAAILWWIVVFGLIGRKIDSYAEKLWFEISYLETSVVLANKEKAQGIISKIVEEMIRHPEYFEKGESYGLAFYKM